MISFNFIDKKTIINTLFILFFYNFCQAQTTINLIEKDLRERNIDSINFNEVRLSQIIIKSSEDLLILDGSKDIIEDTTNVQLLNNKRKDHIANYEFFKKNRIYQNIANLSNRDLENLNRQWTNQKNNIESIIKNYFTVIDNFEKETKSVEKIKIFWEKYREQIDKKEDNTVLSDDLKNINNEIKILLPAIEKNLDQSVVRVNSLYKINIEINSRLDNIGNYLNSVNNLFDKNVNPLWNSFQSESLPIIGNSILFTLKGLLFDLKETAKNFISIHLFVLLLFFFFYFMILRFKKRFNYQKEYIETHVLDLNLVFETPILAAGFYTYIFAYFIYLSLVPAVFIDIISIITISILFFFSTKLFDKLVVNFIKHFIIFWVSVKIVEILTLTSIISRTILLISSIYFLFWLLQFDKKKELNNYIKNTVLARKLLNYYLKLVAIFTLINIISIVFGYMVFAIYIGALTVKITLLVIFLYLLNPLFKRFIQLTFEDKYLKTKNFIYGNKDAILKITFKVINILTYIVFIFSVLEILTIKKPFMTWVNSIFYYQILIGSISFSLWSITLFIIIIILSTFLSKVIQLFLKEEVLMKANLGRGFPETISMLVRYLIIAIGYFLAITSLGFEMSQLTIIFGALSVGIGFGLQNIFNNLVSGLILIFSRPIRIDDTIEINNMIGNVNSIGIRSSNVRTTDGAEVIIPNGNLISNEVINWTLSDQRRRIEIIIGVAYGSDVQKVSKILTTILQEADQVIIFPTPLVLFNEFGDSSLNFRLLFWTDSFSDWIKVKSNVLFKINDEFAKENIEIPFPQRDIHLRS